MAAAISGRPTDVVDLAVVDGRLGLQGPGPDRRQGQRDGRHQAHIGQGRLLTGVLDQGGERVVVGDHYDQEEQGHLQRGPGCL